MQQSLSMGYKKRGSFKRENIKNVLLQSNKIY